jgi:hypothetical protein
VSKFLDLHITHDRVGSSTDPTLNGQLRYPNNLDQSLNDTFADKVHKYRDTTITPLTLYPLYRLMLVRLRSYIVNWSDFYSDSLIGKLTAFLQLQEFCQHNQIVDSSTTSARLSLTSSKAKLVWFLRRQIYVLRLI